jgi:hypothetical protein
MVVKTEIFGNKKVLFTNISDWGYQVIVVNGTEKRKVPLVLGEYDISLAISKLKKINREIDFPFDYLYNIVAGSIAMSMKSGR